MNPDLPLPDPFFDLPLHGDLDGLSRRREDECKTGKVGDESRCDEQRAPHQEHGTVDKIVTRHLTLLHFPLDIGDHPEALLSCIIGTQDSGNNDEQYGVCRADGLADFYYEVELYGRDDGKKEKQPEKHIKPLSRNIYLTPVSFTLRTSYCEQVSHSRRQGVKEKQNINVKLYNKFNGTLCRVCVFA